MSALTQTVTGILRRKEFRINFLHYIYEDLIYLSKMSFTKCLGCEQKHSKDNKFYAINYMVNPLLMINNLRQTYNVKKRKLEVLCNMPENGKICKSCYQISKKPNISIDLKVPDLSIYRKGNRSHNRYTLAVKILRT